MDQGPSAFLPHAHLARVMGSVITIVLLLLRFELSDGDFKMRTAFSRVMASGVCAVLLSAAGVNKADAQSYPIDCAILLCLAGGWPGSPACVQARSEFVRRITPWPVEPPLQIWRCPLRARSEMGGQMDVTPKRHDLSGDPWLVPGTGDPGGFPGRIPIASWFIVPGRQGGPSTSLLPLAVQNRADVDVSGPEFWFIRSIRVFHVQLARRHESGRDGSCRRNAVVLLGTYGAQGEFSWSNSAIEQLPAAHTGLEDWWSRQCTDVVHRSVFVEWRDFQGTYGHEQVNY